MANRKGRTKKGDEPSTYYGPCEDCDATVAVIVDAYQVVGPDRLVCVECRGNRIMAKAQEKADRIAKKAESALEEKKQMSLL